jgi:multiple sugar transport system permease protein
MSAATAVRTTSAKRRARARRLAWHAGILVMLAVLLYPIVWLLFASVKPPDEVVTSRQLLPTEWIWSNFADATEGIVGVSLARFMGNSVLIAGGAVVGTVTSSALAAYAFARLRFRFRGPLFAFMIATIMLPFHVVLIPQYIIFERLGMIGTFLPLVLPKFLATEGFFVFLMVQFMRNIPRELDDAARIDGAGPIRVFARIVLPLTRPALITSAIFSFIWTWNDFLPQLIYLTSPENYTLPIALRLYVDETQVAAYGPMFAVSVITLLPIGLFFFAFQRFLVQGVTTTGLKG